MSSSVAYTVIGGYLGAGKTTLLNHLLANAGGRRVALLINDFGAINIDAELIESRTERQINLTNGCVCCGLADGFDAALDGLLEADDPPEQIVVEASGVADVHRLAQYGHWPGLELAAVVVVADAEQVRAQARDKYIAHTVQRQLRAADLIVLNKTDLVAPERVAALEAWLGELAPDARLLPAVRCAIPLALLGAASRQDLDQAVAHDHAEQYVTWQWSSGTTLSAAAVRAFVDALPPAVLRGKGFFRTDEGPLLWQQVGARSTLSADRDRGGSQIVVIGLRGRLDPETLAGPE